MKKLIVILKNRIENTSVFLKIAILFEVILIASLVLISLFVTHRFLKIVKEKEIELGEVKVEKLYDFVSEKYNRVYSLNNYIHNSEISERLRNIADDVDQAYVYENIDSFQTFFSATSSADADISDMEIISILGSVYSYAANIEYEIVPSYDFLNQTFAKDFLDSNSNISITYTDPTEYSRKSRSPVVSFMCKVYDPSVLPKKRIVGFCMFNIPIDHFNECINIVSENDQGELLIVDSDENIIFSTVSSNCGKKNDENKLIASADEVYHSTRGIGTTDLRIEYLLSNQILFAESNQIRKNVVGLLIAAIIITLLLTFMIYKIYNQKVRVLLDSMSKVRDGNFHLVIPVKSKDEIGLLSEAFNEMCEKINENIALVYKAEIQRKNAQINALQMQINPHFLYNTLESIKSKALEEGDTVTPEMIGLLGSLFRWSMNTNDKITTLENEIEYVSAYLKLQSYRYDEELNISIDIKDEYLDYAIPKLILQPLIENVIKHALVSHNQKGLVGIVAKRKRERDFEITIFDNGQGIKPVKLEYLKEKLIAQTMQDDFEIIGIQNVNRRLHLLFGETYGLQIESAWNYGTAVKVTLPVMSKEEMEAVV